MPYEAAPGETVLLHCQFNDTDGSAAAATTPTASVLEWDSGTSKWVHITSSPFTLTALPTDSSLDGWYGVKVTVPSGAAAGDVLPVRYTGTCDSQTPAASDEIMVRTLGSCYSFTGASTVTLTLTCSGIGVPNQLCVVRNAAETTIVSLGWTNTDGEVELQMDDGIYKVRYGPSGTYSFSNPYDLTVSGATDETYTCTVLSAVACGLTYAEIRSTIGLALHGHGGKIVETSLINQWINQAYVEVDRRAQWTRTVETVTTVAEQETYDRPGDVEGIVAVRAVKYTDTDGNVWPLSEKSMEEHIRLLQDDTTSGDPLHYVLDADTIYLYPTPETADETLTMYCLGTPSKLEEDDDKPSFACHLHDLIITAALAKAYRHIDQDELGLAYEAVFEQQLDRAARRADMNRAASSNTSVTAP